jgi:hypothetical protein
MIIRSNREHDQATASKRKTQATVKCFNIRGANKTPRGRLVGSVLSTADHGYANSPLCTNQGEVSLVNVQMA